MLCDEPKNPVSSKWLGLWYTVSINYEWNGNAESFCTVAEFSTYGVCDGEFSLFVLSANGHCPTPWMHVLQNTSMLKYTYLKKEFERLTLVRTPPIVVMDDESGLQPFKFKLANDKRHWLTKSVCRSVQLNTLGRVRSGWV